MKTHRFKVIFGGYTLVELLVVASIISLLSSIVLVALTTSKARAQDTQKVADLTSVKTAMTTYKIDHNNTAPVPIGCTGGCTPVADGSYLIFDTDPGNPFNATLKPALVDNKYLNSLPPQPIGLFYYYKPGTNGDTVVIGATLATSPSSSGGSPGTCRPFASAVVDDPPPNQYTPPVGSTLCVLVGPGVVSCTSYVAGFVVYGYNRPTACANNYDDDGDGQIDYPNDPGCASINDDDETVRTSNVCSNNTQNTDYCLCM